MNAAFMERFPTCFAWLVPMARWCWRVPVEAKATVYCGPDGTCVTAGVAEGDPRPAACSMITVGCGSSEGTGVCELPLVLVVLVGLMR